MQTTRTRQRRWQDHKHLTRSLIAGACLGLLATGSALAAAPTSFPIVTTTVKVDGIALTGSGLTNTVVFDNGQYYLWYKKTNSLETLSLATSDDGVNFVYQGAFAPTGASPWWTQLMGLDGYPTEEPILGYPRLQKVGDNWIMAIWYSNNPGGSHEYTYNTTIWNLGNSPGNLNATQIGPLNDLSAVGTRPGGPGGQHVGTFGIIRDAQGNDTIYLRGDSREPTSTPGGGLGRYGLKGGVLTSLPVTLPEGGGTHADAADLFTGAPLKTHDFRADDARNRARV